MNPWGSKHVKLKEVKCPPCTGTEALYRRTAHRGSRGIALPFHDHGTRGGEGSASRSGRFTPGKDPVPIVQEAGWAPGPVWTGAPTRIRSPDRPARSESLYWLSYPALNFHTAAKCFSPDGPLQRAATACLNQVLSWLQTPAVFQTPAPLFWPNLRVNANNIPYPTAFPYGNGMVLHFYQQQESSTTKTVHRVINKGLKTYV